MKKNIISVLAIMTVSVVTLAGCSASVEKKTQSSESAASSEQAGLANPWTKSDEQGVAKATGFDMVAPDDASDVSYSYMADGVMAQMTYELDGAKWIYRMQMTDALTDISGMEYQWLEETDCSVSGRDAIYYGYTAASNDATEIVQVVNWYDVVTGVTYSLSATGKEFGDTEMLTYAENLYVPLQGDVSDDSSEEHESELSN